MAKFNPGDRVAINGKCSISEWCGEKATVVRTLTSTGSLNPLVIIKPDNVLEAFGEAEPSEMRLSEQKLDRLPDEPAVTSLDVLRKVVSDLRAQGMTVDVTVTETVTNVTTI